MTPLTAIISGIFIVLAAIINNYRNEIKELFKTDNVKWAVDTNPKISEILERMATIKDIKKAVLIKVHNSGMRIMAGDSIYGTIIYPTSWRSSLNNQVLDIEYQEKVIQPLIQEKKVIIKTEDLERHLKAIFEFQGIKTSVCYLVKQMPEKFFFVAFDFEIEENEIDAYAKDEMRKAINEIRTLMK